jgi:carbon monoxide dehydrogenase subunit G
MELNAQYTFSAPIARVWAGLMDPAIIAGCLPGCQKFEPIGKDRYQVVVTAGVAAITGTFEGSVTIADKVPEKSYRLIVDGKGRPGFATGESTVTLAVRDGSVVLDVTGTMTIGGLIAQCGQRLLGITARMMMDRFFSCLQSKIQGSRQD